MENTDPCFLKSFHCSLLFIAGFFETMDDNLSQQGLDFYSFPNHKILEQSKLKEFADDKINVTEKLKFVWEGLKTLWKKEKMLLPVFSPFPTMFSEGFIYNVIVW